MNYPVKKKNRQRNQQYFFNSLTNEYELIPTTTEFFNKCKEITNLRDKALISVLYLTGARENEILGKFKANQIKEIEREGYKFIHFVNIPTLKKRDLAEHNPRTIPILKSTHYGFLSWIFAYIKEISEDANKSLSEPLFTMTDRNLRYITEKWLGINPHRIRHYRATNLSREKEFNEAMLRRFFNWSFNTHVGRYTQNNVNDIELQETKNLMIKGLRE